MLTANERNQRGIHQRRPATLPSWRILNVSSSAPPRPRRRLSAWQAGSGVAQVVLTGEVEAKHGLPSSDATAEPVRACCADPIRAKTGIARCAP